MGFTVGILDFASAYPWLIGKGMMFVTQELFSAWFIILGIKILICKLDEGVALDNVD